MNNIIDVRVEMNFKTKMRPMIYCLFDSIETNEMIFDITKSPVSKKTDRLSEVLLRTMDIGGLNLLAISNDLAVWYYYSASNRHGFYQDLSLKIRENDEIVERPFDGLWMSNAEATNLWFPKTLVMSISATDKEDEFIKPIGQPMGAVANVVVDKLKQQGYPVGLVISHDGYKEVEPLMPDGTAKNGKVVKIL